MNKTIMTGYVSKVFDTNKKGEKSAKSFNIAVQFDYKTDNEVNADFFKCVIYDNNVKYFDKYIGVGDRISIVGKLKNNNYSKADGTKVYQDVIKVEQIELLCKKKVKNDEKQCNDLDTINDDSANSNDDIFYDDFFTDFINNDEPDLKVSVVGNKKE